MATQASGMVIGAVIAAALIILGYSTVILVRLVGPKVRRVVRDRLLRVTTWRGHRKTVRMFPTVVSRAWVDDVEVTTLWSAITGRGQQRCCGRYPYCRCEGNASRSW